MKSYSKWKDEKVQELFAYIENGKKQNINLTKLFNTFAKQSGRMPNSVRNYYYLELNNLLNNPNRAQKLGINLEWHQKNNPQEFSDEESKKLVMDILTQTSKGISVRKACLNLANGDINKMVRYQNKFRTIEQKDKNIYNDCVSQLKLQGVNIYTNAPKVPDNIVQFQQKKSILTDSDINSLFIGLVKLVKKQATEEVDKTLKMQNEKANLLLRKTLIQLNEKENEIKNLRKNFKVLSENNQKLNEELKIIRGKNAELLTKFGTKNNNEKIIN